MEDKVECIEAFTDLLTKGKLYTVKRFSGSSLQIKSDNNGVASTWMGFNRWFKLHTSTPKFKVGETVRVIGDSHGTVQEKHPHGIRIGNSVEIKKAYLIENRPEWGQMYNVTTQEANVLEQDLELVTENEEKVGWKSFLEMIHEKKEKTQKEETKMSEVSENRRIVDIFITDMNKNVPPEEASIYIERGRTTDLGEEALGHKIYLQALLNKHNEKVRTKYTDKDGRPLKSLEIGDEELRRVTKSVG